MTKAPSFRVALVGFEGNEYRVLAGCFDPGQPREPGYELTSNTAEADLVVCDGDSPTAVSSTIRHARTPFVLFVGNNAPISAVSRLTRPIDAPRILRCLDVLVATHGIEIEARKATLRLSSLQAAKVRVRQRVREALQSGFAPDIDMANPLIDVLVLDPDEAAREHLSGLLRHFGFAVHVAGSVAQAAELLEVQSFVAAFLDVPLDSSDAGEGVALCRLAKDSDLAPYGRMRALVIVSAKINPSDRVRAMLAGVDAHVAKPLARGDVARLLMDCGVQLPSDDRR